MNVALKAALCENEAPRPRKLNPYQQQKTLTAMLLSYIQVFHGICLVVYDHMDSTTTQNEHNNNCCRQYVIPAKTSRNKM